MSKLLYSATMSLDGFIAGPGGDMSWLADTLAAPNPGADTLMNEIGALLVGRRTFAGDDPNRGTDNEGAFGGKWSGPVFVLTRDPSRFGVQPGITFVGNLEAAVAAAKEAAGEKYVNVLGAETARGCIRAGLLDEVMVYTAGVLLGDGVRLFEHPGGTAIHLEPLDRPDVTGATGKWFRIVGNGTHPGTERSAKDVVADMLRRQEASDDTVLDDLVAEDMVNHAAGPQGRNGLKRILANIEHDLGPVTIEQHHLLGDGDLVAQHLTLRGTHRASTMPLLADAPVSGRPTAWTFIHLWRVADGLIVEHWACRDDMELLNQVRA